VRLAVAGKGGAGKSVLAGTLARVLARRGHRVLALDSDMQPGLALSLGADAPERPPLLDAAERGEDRRWRLRRGIGPVRAVQRFATPAPDGVRLLQAGKPGTEGPASIMASVQAFYQVVHHLDAAPSLRSWWMVGDLPAGGRQIAFDWAPYAERYLVVTEPTSQSLLTARRVARLARLRGAEVAVVAGKVRGPADVERVERFLGEPVLAAIPADEAVREAERHGVAVVDAAPGCAAVRAVEALAETLESR
jgi:CO dehydrogenase maturation factor